jgi:hypothetical protein
VGLLTFTLGLPLAPIRGVVWIGELIQEQVEQELRDPMAARRALEEAQEARARGELSADEEAEVQRQVLRTMTRPGAGPDHDEGR